jgi:predicted metalloprotease with PDZ domain
VIEYRIQPVRPEAHLFEIHLTIPEPMPEGQCLSLPAWIPGSYMVRDFARHVVAFHAGAGEQSVAWRKLDKQTWQLEPVKGPVQITYQVYAWDLSVRGAHLDITHGYFNGPCVFMAAMGHEDQPCHVEILPPEGKDYATWRLATGMPRTSGNDYEFGHFQADNHDALMDYPVEMGHFDHAEFHACGVPHQVVINGLHQTDMARLCHDLEPICEHHIKLFGEPAPVDHYVFMTQVTGNLYGGLEHRNSTSLMCPRKELPRRTDPPGHVSDGYRNYLGLCSHEYFHTWNIKRIKPEVFTPFDLSQEVHTELLWAFEGITSYYDELALARTGLITPESYLELLGKLITRVHRGQGRFKQTVTESSFDAWTRFYKQDENAPNAIVSYYAKGALVALALDLTIRDMTGEEKSLDDLMRLLWQRYGQTGEGVPEQGIQPLAEEVTGQSMADFFSHALYSTEDLPLADLLEKRGIHLAWRAAQSHADMGGSPGKADRAAPHLGVRLAEDPAGARIAICYEQGAAMEAGLSAGDVVIAVGGLKVDARNLDDILSGWHPGEQVAVHAFRRDELMRFSLTLREDEPTTAWLQIDSHGLNEKGRAWLHQGEAPAVG